MKFVALVSGGKDSFYAAYQAVQNGHELVACAHLAPHPARGAEETDGDEEQHQQEEEEESYMYQTAGSEAVRIQVNECLNVPLYVRTIVGKSVRTNLVYDHRCCSTAIETTCSSGINIAGAVADATMPASEDERRQRPQQQRDEVEDLYDLLTTVLHHHPTIRAVSSGAILSTYQRTRIESVCSRLHLASLSYLWRCSSQSDLLTTMLSHDDMDMVLVKVACPPGLTPRKHLGKSLRTLHDNGTLSRLQRQYGMHPAGEGGEYETIVLDCPLFSHKRLVLDETEIIENECDGTGILRIVRCHAERKVVVGGGGGGEEDGDDGAALTTTTTTTKLQPEVKGADKPSTDRPTPPQRPPPSSTSMPSPQPPPAAVRCLPRVRCLRGGLCHVSEILSPSAALTAPSSFTNSSSSSNGKNNEDDAEAQLAVTEFLSIIDLLNSVLSNLYQNTGGCNPTDVVFVHLYLSNITHFALINEHYKKYFGTYQPPSRSCIDVGPNVLPGGRRAMMDCLIQRGSGSYLRPPPIGDGGEGTTNNKDNNDSDESTFVKQARINSVHRPLRSNLHVQSLSSWAPVCVGPYAQANVVRGGIALIAGQIGLIPRNMTLIEGGWANELEQSWRNVASILDALDNGRLDDGLGGVIYLKDNDDGVDKEAAEEEAEAEATMGRRKPLPWHEASTISAASLENNGGIVPGRVDGTETEAVDELYGGYEDEGTWREMTGEVEGGDVGSSVDDETDPTDALPLLIVSVPALPVGASAEVELVCASRAAAACLKVRTTTSRIEPLDAEIDKETPGGEDGAILWDVGYDGHDDESSGDSALPSSRIGISNGNADVRIGVSMRSVGTGCAALCFVSASSTSSSSASNFNADDILDGMLGAAARFLTHLVHSVLHVRLFYVATSSTSRQFADDGMMLRSSLHGALASRFGSRVATPACTVVPVSGLRTVTVHPSGINQNDKLDDEAATALFVMQILVADMVHMETELWVHHER